MSGSLCGKVPGGRPTPKEAPRFRARFTKNYTLAQSPDRHFQRRCHGVSFMKTQWPQRITDRLVRYWPLKALGTTLFMALFFWAYFQVLHQHDGLPTVMPRIWLDDWIAFTPYSFPIYALLWVYVSLPPALMGNLRALILYGLWVASMCVLCLALFWLFPTQTPTVDIDWRNYPGLAMIKGVDAAGNACPSLHVASAVFSACWLGRILDQLHTPKSLTQFSWVICLAIAWSTMASLQHVALDVLCGAVVGLGFALVSLQQIKNTA